MIISWTLWSGAHIACAEMTTATTMTVRIEVVSTRLEHLAEDDDENLKSALVS